MSKKQKKETATILRIRFDNGDWVRIPGVKALEVTRGIMHVKTNLGERIYNWSRIFAVEEVDVAKMVKKSKKRK
jgi:hypothetical protein